MFLTHDHRGCLRFPSPGEQCPGHAQPIGRPGVLSRTTLLLPSQRLPGCLRPLPEGA